ncbi:hypothetical protein V8G54_011444 [Vigna mungo]|uniref:Uncharacterized protein n=1 Tax=Vigna mungo TaxID=3915 RepID=A0AAQ3S2B1_VIGMU
MDRRRAEVREEKRCVRMDLSREWLDEDVWNPYGGVMDEISASATPFPHRKGNLFLVQYFVFWNEDGAETYDSNMKFSKLLYEFMTPFVLKTTPPIAVQGLAFLSLSSCTPLFCTLISAQKPLRNPIKNRRRGREGSFLLATNQNRGKKNKNCQRASALLPSRLCETTP